MFYSSHESEILDITSNWEEHNACRGYPGEVYGISVFNRTFIHITSDDCIDKALIEMDFYQEF